MCNFEGQRSAPRLERGKIKTTEITSKEDLDSGGKRKNRLGLWGRKYQVTGILPSEVEVTEQS